MKDFFEPWFFRRRKAGTFSLLPIAGIVLLGDMARAQTKATPANDFLGSLGVCTHMTQGLDNAVEVANCLTYEGIRNIRDDGSSNTASAQNFITVYNSSGAKVCLLPISGNLAASLAEYETVAAAGALLAVEGPNEINNFPITYQGQTSSYSSTFLPAALFQRDLYRAVKGDPALAGIPVFAPSEAGGSEPDNVGFQFLTIPAGSGISMPDGTIYADFANVHNYLCSQLTSIVDNNAWDAENTTGSSQWDGLYGEYSKTWHEGFAGYFTPQLQGLSRVTTETGWTTQGTNSITEDQQGKLFLNLYLAAYKQGWSYTFIYMLRDDPNQGYWGLVGTDYSPKLSGTYIHNLTTILADNNSATTGLLAYSIAGEPATVHDLLLQKSNGSYELAVWDENVSGSDTITVNLGATYPTVNVYDPTVGTAISESLSNVSSVPLTLSDHPEIIEIPSASSPSPAPTPTPTPVPKANGLTDADIGSPGEAGSAAVSGNTITVLGSGADIWNAADQFNYDSESVTGDSTLVVHVDSMQDTDSWAKAGLMFRNSSTAGAAYVGIYENPGGAVELQWRDTDGAQANWGNAQLPGTGAANWLELVKNGTTYTAYYATTTGVPTAVNWMLAGTHTTAFTNATCLAGLAVTAHNNSLLNSSVFSSFSVMAMVSPTPTPTPTPVPTESPTPTPTPTPVPMPVQTSGLTDEDMGNPADTGSAVADDNTITVQGGGADIWNAADQFNYDGESVTGDSTLIVHVDSMQNTNSWAKAGLMFRNSSSPSAANVGLYENPSNVVEMQWRDTDGTQANYAGQVGPAGSAKWLELVKSGTTFTAYYATTTGVPTAGNWILAGTHTTAFTNATYLAGLAVTAHDDTLLNTTVFSSFSISNAPGASNTPTPTPTPTPVANPAPAGAYTDADIGNPLPGSATAGGSTVTVNGSGSDIWNASDQFNYYYQTTTTQTTIIAHVDSMQNTNAWAKAGLMFRNSISAGAAYVGLYENPGNAVELQWRDTDGAQASYAGQVAPTGSANWLELVKTGNIFTAYYATTAGVPAATDWVLVGVHMTTFSQANFLAGLAVTSHDDGVVNTSVFSGLSQF